MLSSAAAWWVGLSWFWAIEFGVIGNGWGGRRSFQFEKETTPFVFLVAGVLASWFASSRWASGRWWRQMLPGLLAGSMSTLLWWIFFIEGAKLPAGFTYRVRMLVIGYPTTTFIVVSAVPACIAAWLLLGERDRVTSFGEIDRPVRSVRGTSDPK